MNTTMVEVLAQVLSILAPQLDVADDHYDTWVVGVY